MENGKPCARCGTVPPGDAPQGLCPRCLGAMNLAEDTAMTGMEDIQSTPPPSPEDLARLFPQLEILGMIGRGGMGAVYKARQKQLDRLVALKILPPRAQSSPAFEERFAREARALAKLNHPGVVTLYEFGQSGGLCYFLMEYVDGVNLRQLIEGDRISPREALAIVPQICDALQYAHDQGIVHRDIKPENLLMDRAGRIKVADFGLAKLMTSGNEPVPGENESGSMLLTGAGKVMGTPHYMAPEQVARPTEVDHRADIYSLGVVFYQMLTGELPSTGQEPASAKLNGLRIDVRLEEAVLRAMEREPHRRYQQASVLKTQIETIAAAPDNSHASPRPKFSIWDEFRRIWNVNPARIVRWAARGLGTLVILSMLPFILAEGLPPIASQPAGVQLTFSGAFLLFAGFLVGWRRDGSAALLIGAGWTIVNISEGMIGLNPFHLVLGIAWLYGYCWWCAHKNNSRLPLAAVGFYAIALVSGLLFCPVNVFMTITVADAATGSPIAGTRVLIMEPSRGPNNKASEALTNGKGSCQLYLGWYDGEKTLRISAPGYEPLDTKLGPCGLGKRRISRKFELVHTQQKQ